MCIYIGPGDRAPPRLHEHTQIARSLLLGTLGCYDIPNTKTSRSQCIKLRARHAMSGSTVRWCAVGWKVQ